MIFSKNLRFSNNQAITASAASTNVVDLRAPGTVYGAATALATDLGPGHPIPLLVQVTEDFAGLTSLEAQVQVDDNEAFTSPTTVLSNLILLADLVAGRQTSFQYVPRYTNERYLRIYYEVVGVATAGTVTAGITMGNQSNE